MSASPDSPLAGPLRGAPGPAPSDLAPPAAAREGSDAAAPGVARSVATAPPLELAGGRVGRRAQQVAWRALWTSRLLVLFAGVLAVLQVGRNPGTEGFDPANLTAPFGYFANLLVSPFARWDSVWYLAIAKGGYAHQLDRTAFFPGYPLAVRGIGDVVGSDLVGGLLVSLVAFALGLALLYRLVDLELGAERAQATVLLVAFCPMAYFFSAVYSESLFLVLSVGCLLCARQSRWWAAGALGFFGALTRNSGVLLIVPVMIMFLYGPRRELPRRDARTSIVWWRSPLRALRPRYRVTPAILWAGLIPLGALAYLGYLGLTYSGGSPDFPLPPYHLSLQDALAPFHAEAHWYRHFLPLGGTWKGAVAAWDGLRQLLHGPAPPIYFKAAGGDPLAVGGQNLLLFSALAIGAVALVGVLRTLPFAYGAYAACSLAMSLSEPVAPQPLASLPRYEVVLFPLFMWAAALLVRRRAVTAGVAACAVLLGLFTAEFATWRFVA